MFRFELSFDTGKLRFDPVNGRRTFYAYVTIGRHTWWVMRWDTNRCDRVRVLAKSFDGLMCISVGHRALNRNGVGV